MILDDTGNPLKPKLSEEEVLEKLKEVAPKNKEQEVLLAKRVGEMAEYYRKRKIVGGIEDGGYDDIFYDNIQQRKKGDSFTEGRDYRHIASIPREMAYVAEQVFGPEVWTDKATFKKAFKEDDTGKLCLTVDPDSI